MFFAHYYLKFSDSRILQKHSIESIFVKVWYSLQFALYAEEVIQIIHDFKNDKQNNKSFFQLHLPKKNYVQ